MGIGLLVACSGRTYGGRACSGLALGTDESTLPVLTTRPYGMTAPAHGAIITGTDELRCCLNRGIGTMYDCTLLDCDAYVPRVMVSSLGGKYEREPCGLSRPGFAECWALTVDQKVVGVWAACFD